MPTPPQAQAARAAARAAYCRAARGAFAAADTYAYAARAALAASRDADNARDAYNNALDAYYDARDADYALYAKVLPASRMVAICWRSMTSKVVKV